MSRMAPLLVGALGGITPNLLTLAVQLTAKDAQLPSLTYLIGLLIFAGLGAGIAYAWEESNLKKAFYLGVGLPSLIQLNVANLGVPSQANVPSAPSVISHSGVLLIGVARAEEIGSKIEARRQQPQALNRKFVLVPGEVASAPYYYVVFFTERSGGRGIERFSVTAIEPRGRIEIVVPDYASCAMVQVSNDSFGGRICWPYEPGIVRAARLDVKESRWSGLLRSLGVIGAGSYRITLTSLTSS